MTRSVSWVLMAVALLGAVVVGFGATLNPAFVLMALGAACLLALLVLQPLWGILILVALGFFEALLPDIAFGLSAMKAVGILVMGSWVLMRLVSRTFSGITFGPVEISILAFGVGLLVSMTVAEDQSVARSFLLRYAMFFLLTVIVADALREYVWAWRFVWVVVCAGALAAVVGLGFFLTGSAYRAEGPLSDPNDQAFALMMTLLMGIFLIPQERGGRRIALVCLVALTAVGLAATLSRGAAIGVAVGVLWGVLLGRVRVRYLVVGLVAIGALAVAVYMVAPERVAFAVQMKSNWGAVTASQRLDRWGVALRMFEENPWLGVGVGHYGVLFGKYGGVGFQDANADVHDVAHNMYLEVMAETGVLGFVPFLVLIGAAVWLSVRAVRCARAACLERGAVTGPPDDRSVALGLATGASAALVGMLTASIFLTEQYFPPIWVVVGFTVGLERMLCSGSCGAGEVCRGSDAGGGHREYQPDPRLSRIRS